MAKRGENIYQRKDGRWEARVIRGYDDNGKAVYAYFYGHSYREAKAKSKNLSLNVYYEPKSESRAIGDTLYFEIVLDSWLGNSKVKLKDSTYVKYHNIINNHIKPSLGKHPLTGITSTIINEFASEKLKSGRHGSSGGLSEKTVKDIISVIKSVLRYAKAESLMPDTNLNINLPREKKRICAYFQKMNKLFLKDTSV